MKIDRLIEQWGPLLVALAAAAVSWRQEFVIPGAISKELLGALLSAGAISAGFLTTALTILMPLGTTKLGERLRQQQLMPDLHAYLRAAIFSWLFVAAIAVCLFFVLTDNGSRIPRIPSALLVGATAHAALAMGRILHILMNIFERMSEPEDQQG